MVLSGVKYVYSLGIQSMWLTFAQLAPFFLGFIIHRLIGALDTYSAFGLLDKLGFAAILGGTGMMQALFFFGGRDFGRKDQKQYEKSIANGIGLALFLALVLSGILFFSGHILQAIGIDPKIIYLAKELAPCIAVLIIPTLLLTPIKIHLVLHERAGLLSMLFSMGSLSGVALCYYIISLNQLNSLEKTQTILLAVAAANTLVLFLALPFAFRTKFALPMPKTIVQAISFDQLQKIIALGWPISGVILIENFAILLSLLIISKFWPQFTSIQSIALLWISIGLLVALGVSQAIVQKMSILWSQENFVGARKNCLAALVITLGFSLFLVILFSLYPFDVVNLFYQRTIDSNEVRNMVPFIMIHAGILCLFQSLIIVLAAILRGIGQTRAPLYQAFIGYGLFGGLSQFVFAFMLNMGVRGLWVGMNFGFAITVLILFRKVVKEINLLNLSNK